MDDDFDFDDFDDIVINDAGGGTIEESGGRAEVRAKELGYRPQKEVIYNKLLPYSDKLDAESAAVWRSVKGELGTAFARREIRPAGLIWISRMCKYIRMYGYKFPKEDHLALVRLFYDLLVQPNMEPWMANKAAATLVTLLKKRELIGPEDGLNLDWRPLYDVYERLLYSKDEAMGMVHYPPSLEANLRSAVRCCRPYFPPGATQEMLDEWRPLMCPYDVTMGKAFIYFNLFLPTFNVLEHRGEAFDLWFAEFMGFWRGCSNSPPWESALMSLYARLADHNIGHISWAEHVPTFFSRFVSSFNLPVHFKKTAVANKVRVDLTMASKWIVATLGGEGENATMRQLAQMFRALESYFHPANSGRYSPKLHEFLGKLTSAFTRRVHRERYSRSNRWWANTTLESARLSDADITEFVTILKPIAFHVCFSRIGILHAIGVFQLLSALRPELILPELLERMEGALATLTEPHKLTASMHALNAVCRSLVFPNREGGLQVTTNVIPLLNAVLPGIDPNDLGKSMATFQFITTFATLIPLSDSSKAHEHYSDLTEEERAICAQTAEMEDFVVQFLDRCFSLIESSSFQQTREEQSASDHRRNREDGMKDMSLGSTFFAILTQSSSAVYDAALRKVQGYMEGRILEARVAGRIAAGLCRALCKVRPERALSVFLPPALERVKKLLGEVDVDKEENLDQELLFNLLMLVECVRISGEHLLPHLPSIEAVLERSLLMASKEGQGLATSLMRNVLRALTLTYPNEFRSVAEGYDRPVEEYLPVRDWGRPGNIHNLNLDWHVASKEEVAQTERIVRKFAKWHLDALRGFASGATDSEMSKERLKRHLIVVDNLLRGAGSLLPFWTVANSAAEDVALIADSVCATRPLPTPECAPAAIDLEGGKNVRLEVIAVMDLVQARLLRDKEDDTKSLTQLTSVYATCVRFGGIGEDEYESRLKSYQAVRRALDNRLVGSRRQLRPVIVDRAMLQHEARLLERCHVPFTDKHKQVMDNLLTLSTSHYSAVRSHAQGVLLQCTNLFAHSYKLLIPRLTELLASPDAEISHEEFKGALYVVLGYKNKPLLAKHSWSTVEALWPAVVDANRSEKPSVVKLLDAVLEAVGKFVDTIDIEQSVGDEVVARARALWQTGSGTSTLDPALPPPSEDEVSQGAERLAAKNSERMAAYRRLLDKLCDRLESGKLHWRHYNMGIGLLSLLTRSDVKMPARVAKIYVGNLTHENIKMRKAAYHALGCILRQQKRAHPKVEINPVPDPSSVPAAPGDREDNRFMCYDAAERSAPRTAAEWAAHRAVHKTHWGYYTWPKKMLVYAEVQPDVRRAASDLNEVERVVFDFFSDSAKVTKLVEFLSLEEHKGRDKFDSRRFFMFKALFRNYGDTVLTHLRPHLDRLIVEDGSESAQRCASELVAALVRGAKHWTFEMTEELWAWLAPLIRKALEKVSVETMADWGTAFATASESRDPNRIHQMLEVLMEEPLRSQGSFIDSSRLYMLQGGIAQQEWRVAELLHRLVDFMRPYLSHPYQNVRDRIGSVLTNIYLSDIEYPDRKEKSNKRNPNIATFMAEVAPQLELLKQEPDPDVVKYNRKKLQQQLQHGAMGEPNGVFPPAAGMNMMPRMPPPGMVPPGMMMPPPGMVLPPGMHLPPGARMPPPEVLARMLPPELAARLPPPEVMAGMAAARMRQPVPVPPEAMQALNDVMGALPPQGMVPMDTNGAVSSVDNFDLNDEKAVEYEKRQVAIRLLQTVSKFLAGSLYRAFNGVKPECFQLLEVLCINESNELEPNLARDCTVTLAYFASTPLPREVVGDFLSAVEGIVARSASWKAKSAALDLLQVSVFFNMPTILSNPEWVSRVMSVVVASGIESEERVEVRVKAGAVLSGLLHCQFVGEDKRKELMESFRKRASTKLKKAKDSADDSESAAAKAAQRVRKRHSGVIGLCSFVNAFPYDVPAFVPDVLMHLSAHLHDPQPIPVIVKKTLQDFKRTHQDNWQDHKQKFTEDQLTVLTDLLVSPSYYA